MGDGADDAIAPRGRGAATVAGGGRGRGNPRARRRESRTATAGRRGSVFEWPQRGRRYAGWGEGLGAGAAGPVEVPPSVPGAITRGIPTCRSGFGGRSSKISSNAGESTVSSAI